jgi:hypothetical protein
MSLGQIGHPDPDKAVACCLSRLRDLSGISQSVIPAKAGISQQLVGRDSRFRGNDDKGKGCRSEKISLAREATREDARHPVSL